VRVQALGERVYPVVICSSCFRVTGWTGTSGECISCLFHKQMEAAYTDPHAGWVHLGDTRAPEQKRSILAVLAGLVSRERARARAWRARVDPGTTGPVAPEEGFEIEVAKRGEVGAPDGTGIIVRFGTATYRFDNGRWAAADRTRIAQAELLVPPEFSAAIPIEQLAEAWGDYHAEVASFNERRWRDVAARRDAERTARQERAEMLLREQHVSEFLDES
jgi:hypothetical protein